MPSWHREPGGRVNHKRVARVMHEHDIVGYRRRRRVITYSCATLSVSYAYDYNGNLTSETDGTGSYATGYDWMNRPTGITLPGSTVLGYGNDADGDLTSLTQDGAWSGWTCNRRGGYI